MDHQGARHYGGEAHHEILGLNLGFPTLSSRHWKLDAYKYIFMHEEVLPNPLANIRELI